MEKFAGYGFNKAHAAAYALVAYQTAYFKAHHTSAFMAANLSLVMDDTDKVRIFRDDAIGQGIAVLPPDVNASNYRFEPVDAKQIRYGLGGVKGTGEAAIEAIVAARAAGGPFRDLFDFCRRVDKRAVNRRAVEALIRAGAFDAIEPRRAALLASVGIALEAAERAEANAAQVSLFGEESARALRRPRRDARVDGRRAPAAREGRDRLLPVRASVRRLRRRARADHPHDDRQPGAAAGAHAGRRHRHADARAGEPARQDGVRDARRRPRLGRDHDLQRDLRQRALAAARGPAGDRRGQGHAADDRGRRGAGTAHHRREHLRPGDDPPQAREGIEARVQRQRVGHRARRDPAAVPPRRQGRHRQLSQRARRRRSGAVRGLAREPRRRAASSACASGWRRRTCRSCTDRGPRIPARPRAP